VVVDNNLFDQLEQLTISMSLSMKNISEDELNELNDRLAKGNNISTKQLAVTNDILSKYLGKSKYRSCVLENYALYIKHLISKFSDSSSIEDINTIDDINASFIRCYIHKDINKSTSYEMWKNII